MMAWEMNTRTSLALFAATALATRLLGGLSMQEPSEVRQADRPTSVPAAPPTPSNEFAYTDALRERLKVPPPERGRNPFAYGTRHSTASSPASVDPAPEPMPAPLPAPAFTPLKLTGIASDQKDGARILTAILNEHGSIVLVKDGDRLSSGYTVVKVDEMSVTLADANGVTMTLRLP
jgi:hypothetical protein